MTPLNSKRVSKGAICRTCGGEVPNHKPSMLDKDGIGHPDHKVTHKPSQDELEQQIREAVKTIMSMNGDNPVYIISQAEHDKRFQAEVQAKVKAELEDLYWACNTVRMYQDDMHDAQEVIEQRIKEIDGRH